MPPAELKAVEKVSPAGQTDLGVAMARLLRPQAAYRWLLPSLAAITPQYIEATLRGALAGNHVQAWELFDLMLDTWPELSACTQELTLAVQARTLRVEPYREEDEEPSEDAQRKARVVSAALRRMNPDICRDENDLNRTIADIMSGWFLGQVVVENLWGRDYDSTELNTIRVGDLGQVIAPRGTSWVHPVCFAWDMTGKIGLRMELATADGKVPALSPGVWQMTSWQPRPTEVRDFPPHKFMVGLHKQKAGTVLGGGMLRVLAWWWCAANFTSDWLLNLAQLFGLPFRFANYDPNAPQATIDAVCAMLENMGSAGWAAFPAGTTLDLKDVGKNDQNSAQGQLLDRADRYARMIILGQTLSGAADASRGGGKAFGQVETGVKEQRIAAASQYVCDTLGQLVRSILILNFGDADEAPCLCLASDQYADGNEANRDMALASGGLEISKAWLYRKYNIAPPDDDEETIGGKAPTPKAPEMETEAEDDDPDGDGDDDSTEEGDTDGDRDELEAAETKAEQFDDAALEHFAAAVAADLEHVRALVAGLNEISDDRILAQRALEVRDEIERLKADIRKLPKSAQALAEIQTAAFFNGLTQATTKAPKA